ncbi:MAG TPA: phosphopentomutase [Gemmatimonadales bacterium]|nr:phosphopentomutase [Gemmatimonadales bacterium]HRZ08505.1 phosphopentomutase [Gemmatimonadales bacterium]
MSRRAAIIVLDGLGIGQAHDADAYGDTGSDTLGNTLRASGGLRLPHLEALGLGNCATLAGVPSVAAPTAAWGTCQPVGAGKDSTTGHWEICGLPLEHPFPTYPGGFPPELVAEFASRTGRGVIGNKAASGTAILDELGEEHRRTGAWIVYTSADSVFQVAAHQEVVPLEELYAACQAARDLLRPPHGVSRVIARPFVGSPGAWTRTAHRKDFSSPPPGPTLLDRLADRHVPRLGIGKVDDLFAGRNIASVHAATNTEGYHLICSALEAMPRGLIFANILEFDQSWGHRNDVTGFLGGLHELDRALPGMLGRVREEDLVIFTADHGNDPTTPSTDHSRERVPLLVYGPRVRPVALGERATFADIGQTVAEYLGAAPLDAGRSFLGEILDG